MRLIAAYSYSYSLCSWIVTGSVLAGGAIASIEFWAKLALYYAHERAWARAC